MTSAALPDQVTSSLNLLSPYPGRVFANNWKGRFPHLMPVDTRIWLRFLDKFGSGYLGFQYDIMVGQGAKSLPGFSDADKRLLYSLTVKRADALGITEGGITLFEVKPRLGMAGLGQLVAYNLLWYREYGNRRPVQVAIVCEQDEPDLNYVVDVLGFQRFVV